MHEKTFCLLYTSVRPNLMPKVVNDWLSTATEPSKIEVVIAVDSNNQPSIDAARAVPGAHVVIQTEEPFTCVKGWNLAADYYLANCKAPVIIVIADDFNPPQGWDTQLMALEPKGWEDGEFVVKVEDGFVHNIFVLSILTRKRLERYGYLFYGGYLSMFNDTEFGTVAMRDGVVIDANHILIEHMHPDCGKRPRDSADLNHASRDRWVLGETLYNYRKANNFPLDWGPKAVEEKAPEEKYGAFLLVTKDDFCLLDVGKRLYDDGVKDLFFAIPTEYWSGKPVPASEVSQVDAIIDQLRKYGANVYRKVFDVKKYRFPGDSRVTIETRLRNDALSWIRRSGFPHVLIVDGDELWIRGTFAKLKATVYKAKPQAISLPMIPVVGLPGYPVDNASDRAVVYLDSNTNFKVCRTPACNVYQLNSTILFHFTATRRTMEEIIVKMREGGHYDDPEYDFEKWIAETLPNAKPGLKAVHMYKGYQIWPSLREWSSTEINDIPSNLHQYLGSPKLDKSPVQHMFD